MHFPFNLRHTKIIENIDVWKRTETRAGAMKKELRSWSHTHENQDLWSWSHVHEKKSFGAGAVSFLWRLHSSGYMCNSHIEYQNGSRNKL